jgi:aryl-alcohol dehydrogenase-like predicted oxidoreductase
MIDRRRFLGIAAGAGAGLAVTPQFLRALHQAGGSLIPQAGKLIQRAIPSTGEMLPVVGLGFSNHAGCADPAALKDVLKTFSDNGGRFFDTNFANEQKSQDAIVTILNEVGIRDKLFLSWRGYAPGLRPDAASVKAHIDTSLARLNVARLDMVDLPNTPVFTASHWAVLKEAKKAGRIRYISAGVGATSDMSELESLVRTESIDFFSVPFAIDNRAVEEKILPFAQERKIAVMVHWPFGGANGQSCVSDRGLFGRVGNTPLPTWAAEFDAKTWAQFFLKYVISHPAVTVARVGTTKPHHMLDNIGGGIGRLPNEAMRKRMAEFIDDIPLAVPAQFLERYVGEYRSASGLTAMVRREETTLFVKWGSNAEVPLFARSVLRFSDRQGSIIEFKITRPGPGPATVTTGAILERGGEKILLEKK